MKILTLMLLTFMFIIPTNGIAADILPIDKQPLSDIQTVYDDLREFMRRLDNETQEEYDSRVQAHIDESPVRFFDVEGSYLKWFIDDAETQNVIFLLDADNSSKTDIGISYIIRGNSY